MYMTAENSAVDGSMQMLCVVILLMLMLLTDVAEMILVVVLQVLLLLRLNCYRYDQCVCIVSAVNDDDFQKTTKILNVV